MIAAQPWQWDDAGPEPRKHRKPRTDRLNCALCGEHQGRYLRRFCVSCDLRVCADCTSEAQGPMGSPDRPGGWLSVMDVICVTCSPTPDRDVEIERSGKWWDVREGSKRVTPNPARCISVFAMRERSAAEEAARYGYSTPPSKTPASDLKLKKITDLTPGERRTVVGILRIWFRLRLMQRGLSLDDLSTAEREAIMRSLIVDRIHEFGVETPALDEI